MNCKTFVSSLACVLIGDVGVCKDVLAAASELPVSKVPRWEMHEFAAKGRSQVDNPFRNTASVRAGNTLQLSWPSNYVGCRLESNSVSLIAPAMWFTVSGTTATNRFSIPISPLSSNVFFRLAYP